MCQERQRLVDNFWANWETRLGELCLNVKACEGADELVRKLKKANVPMAIATSSRKEGVERKRAKHGEMFESMQVIVPGDHEEVKAGKPAPDIYLAAAKQLGVHPRQCLAFEDAVSGAQSARAAGCRVVAGMLIQRILGYSSTFLTCHPVKFQTLVWRRLLSRALQTKLSRA